MHKSTLYIYIVTFWLTGTPLYDVIVGGYAYAWVIAIYSNIIFDRYPLLYVVIVGKGNRHTYSSSLYHITLWVTDIFPLYDVIVWGYAYAWVIAIYSNILIYRYSPIWRHSEKRERSCMSHRYIYSNINIDRYPLYYVIVKGGERSCMSHRYI